MPYSLRYTIILGVYIASGVAVFITLFFITAPYGRHVRKQWGPGIDKRLGWVIMELVSPLVFALLFIRGEWHEGFMPYFFLSLWMIHYLYRTFVFSTLLRGSISMPLVVIFFGMMFNSANGFLQSQYLYTFSLGPLKYSPTWLYSPQCIIGLVLFFAGFAIHVHADSVTRGLRERGENEYKIPYRGLYSYVSSPNYLGEIIQWCGWGLVTWSLPGIAFAFWTTANLLPRAMANHRWYRKTFTDYPEHRKALIPFIL